jgi:N-acetylneuraminic acid mutarotase
MSRKPKIRYGGLIFRGLAGFIFIAFSISLPSVSFAQEGKWTAKADMPTPRFALSSSVVDGKIYAISGRKSGGGQWLAVVEEYDPATDTWTKKADIPTPRSEFSTSVVDGKIYAIGGWNRESNRPVVEVYDPETDTWTKKADMPIMHVWSATSAVDGKIYAIGGVGGVAMGLAEPTIMMLEEYDPATDRWVRKADMPTARAMLSACAVNGKIYAIGGHFWDSAWQGTTLSAVEEYDPATDTWTKKADMPMPTYGHAATVVNGKIYVMGGTWGEGADTTQVNRVTILSTIMKYDPATDTWTKEGDMRVPRTAMSASVVDGRIYVIGGQEVDVRGISTVEAYQPEPYPADGAESVDLNVELSWTAGLGAALYTVYFGDNLDDVSNATGGLQQGKTTYTPGPLEFAKTYYWRVDEHGLGRGAETHKGDVWSFTTQGAVGSPEPANGAVDVKQTPVLTWNPGVLAALHEVYFGTDEEAVKNATTTSPEYKGTRALGDEILDPGKLAFDTTYFWRVDEVNNTNPDSPWVGNVWSFTTVDFIVVDDFEDYDIGNNEIWWAWKDGSGYASHPTGPPYAGNGTGSMVGDESTGSYTEEIRVHGGSQAMPLFFDNSVLKYSEAEMTLTYPRDWTENGISTLSIWFRGNSANAAEMLYVALNGSAVVNHDNPDAAQKTSWTQWNIDLQAFADQGVDLTNVNTIALGFGDRNNPQPGGKGLMYFDDIRLYRP